MIFHTNSLFSDQVDLGNIVVPKTTDASDTMASMTTDALPTTSTTYDTGRLLT